MNKEDLEKRIAPFFWVEGRDTNSLCLNVGEYKAEIFETREDEGFEGNGYDWGSLALVFISEEMPEFVDVINLDSEAEMFCAYSDDKLALEEFAIAFKDACENSELINDLFSRAELD